MEPSCAGRHRSCDQDSENQIAPRDSYSAHLIGQSLNSLKVSFSTSSPSNLLIIGFAGCSSLKQPCYFLALEVCKFAGYTRQDAAYAWTQMCVNASSRSHS